MDSVFVKKDMLEVVSSGPSSGKAIQLFDNGVYRGVRIGIGETDPRDTCLGVVSLAMDGYVASGFHPGVSVVQTETFAPGARLYAKNQTGNGILTSALPVYNGQTIIPIAIALEGSDSEHYAQSGRVEAIIQICCASVLTDGIDP